MALKKNLKPEDVFTPRSAEVNPAMYVSRPSLESALQTALRGNLHMLIHGESGSGKSWLYKKTLKDNGVPYLVANLANASRLGSIAAELKNCVDRVGKAIKTGYEEEKSAEISAGFASGNLAHTAQYEIGAMEPFEACLAFLNENAKGKTSILVLDNLETCFTPPLLKELADLIILCDDERYAKYKVKILIVGVPSGVKEYFYKTPHLSTVANRLIELPEVSRLKFAECEALVKRGFLEMLEFSVNNFNGLVNHIAWLTDRVPQMIHEYCLELSYISENTKQINIEEVREADVNWIIRSLISAYSVIESHMNERDTKAGRRNQTLFALSLCTGEQFKAPDVENIVRTEFPKSTSNTVLNLPQMLSQLSKGDNPLIRRSPKGDAYTFSDPRYRMVMRAMLIKDSDEKIEKRPITRQ